MNNSHTNSLLAAEPVMLAELVRYQDGSIVSRTLVKQRNGTVTIFAFDKDQSLSEHSAPFDALVYVLEGEAKLVIGGKPVTCVAGQMVLMPADVPHAVTAPARFKMLLVMIYESPLAET